MPCPHPADHAHGSSLSFIDIILNTRPSTLGIDRCRDAVIGGWSAINQVNGPQLEVDYAQYAPPVSSGSACSLAAMSWSSRPSSHITFQSSIFLETVLLTPMLMWRTQPSTPASHMSMLASAPVPSSESDGQVSRREVLPFHRRERTIRHDSSHRFGWRPRLTGGVTVPNPPERWPCSTEPRASRLLWFWHFPPRPLPDG